MTRASSPGFTPAFRLQGADGLERGLAVHDRHHDVHAHQVEGRTRLKRGLELLHRFLPVHGRMAFPIGLEHFFKKFAGRGIIFDNQDFHARPPRLLT